MENIAELKSLLSSPQNITIIAHRNPDGDALGSALGLSAYLKQQGHLLKVVMPSEHPKVFNYMTGIDDMIIFDLKHDEARAALRSASLIFCLDFNGLDRVDTGSFAYNTRSQTYRVAAALKDRGVDDYFLNDKIMNSMKEKHLRLLGHCLANRMKIIPEYGAAYINIEMAGFITEQPTIVKLSLRSKGDISVQEICRQHFNGGGHKNASGGGVYKPLNYVIRKLEEVIPQHLTKREVIS